MEVVQECLFFFLSTKVGNPGLSLGYFGLFGSLSSKVR